MKRDVEREVDFIISVAKRAKKDELVVLKMSVISDVWYEQIEIMRGDYETVKSWCTARKDEKGFDDKYTSQYVIAIA